jgi:hypothetical protein
MAVKNIVPFERLEFHDEGGARITIGSETVNPVGMAMNADPRGLVPVSVIVNV